MEQRGILTRSPSHSWACVFWTKTFQSWELILVLWIFSKRKLNYIVMVWSRKQKSTKQLEQTNKQKYGITKDIERNKRPGDDKTIKNPNIYCISVFFPLLYSFGCVHLCVPMRWKKVRSVRFPIANPFGGN